MLIRLDSPCVFALNADHLPAFEAWYHRVGNECASMVHSLAARLPEFEAAAGTRVGLYWEQEVADRGREGACVLDPSGIEPVEPAAAPPADGESGGMIRRLTAEAVSGVVGGGGSEMVPGFVSRGPVVGEDAVAAFEARCGYRLPSDNREFLLEQNGGWWLLAPLTGEQAEADWEPRPHRFYSLGAAAASGLSVEEVFALYGWDNSLEEWTALMGRPEVTADLDVQMWMCRGDGGPNNYPPEFLPIAVGFREDLLFLRLAGPDAAAVFFSIDPDGYCEWHCYRVAGSFAELLRDLATKG